MSSHHLRSSRPPIVLAAVAALTASLLTAPLASPAVSAAHPDTARPAAASAGTADARRATGLRVRITRPAAARSQVRVTVRGPGGFRQRIKKTKTWRNARPGVYRIKAKTITLFDQRVKPKVVKRKVRVPANRRLRTARVTYRMPAFCARTGTTAYAWGEGDHGRLGTPASTDRLAPALVPRLRGATAITGGLRSSYALCRNGTVWAWGYNQKGELGNGAAGNRAHPVRVRGLTGVTAIAARREGAMALRSDGSVWAWGSGQYGQLGDGRAFTSSSSTRVPVRVALPGRATAIAAGGYNGYALMESGTVYAWGVRGVGQLGNPVALADTSTPVQVSTLTEVAEITAGHATAYARGTDGNVWAWGDGNQGQIGDTFVQNRTSPVQVVLPTPATSIGASHAAGYAVLGGVMWSWGSGRYGDVGFDNGGSPQATPVSNVTLVGVVEVVGAGYGAYALTNNGRIWAWGDHGAGQVGHGEPPTGPSHITGGVPTPVELAPTGVTAIGAGNVNGYALR